MGIRMSGLSSGLDTEAIVGALMSAQSLKKTKIERSKTKLEWTQTKWAELNTKLKNLYTNYVSKMRLESSYKTKKTSVSDPNKASVTASNNAVNGSYRLEIENIATTQYLSGAKLNATSLTDKLTDIDPSLLNKEITVTTGDKTTKIAITAGMTIADFTKSLRDAGLDANYDTAQKRFFISSKESGVDNAFSITSSGLSSAEVSGRQALYQAVGYDNMSAENKKIVDQAMTALQTSGVGTDEYNKAVDSLAKAAYDTKEEAANAAAKTYVKAKLYSENYAANKTAAADELKSQYFDDAGNLKAGYTQDDYDKAVEAKAAEKTEAFVNEKIDSDPDVKLQIQTAAFSGKTVADIQGLSAEAQQKYYATGADGALVIEGFDGTSSYSQSSIQSSITPVATDYANITNRNDALDQYDIETALLENLGAKKILWLKHGQLAGDDTDGHIDTLARILPPGDIIAYTGCDNPDDEHFAELEAMRDELASFTNALGAPFHLVELPLPDPIYDPEDGTRLPATYANFLIINGAVIMPTYGQPKKDALAAMILESAMPEYEIVPVDCRSLIRQHGSLHCATMQLPLGVLNDDYETNN